MHNYPKKGTISVKATTSFYPGGGLLLRAKIQSTHKSIMREFIAEPHNVAFCHTFAIGGCKAFIAAT